MTYLFTEQYLIYGRFVWNSKQNMPKIAWTLELSFKLKKLNTDCPLFCKTFNSRDKILKNSSEKIKKSPHPNATSESQLQMIIILIRTRNSYRFFVKLKLNLVHCLSWKCQFGRLFYNPRQNSLEKGCFIKNIFFIEI